MTTTERIIYLSKIALNFDFNEYLVINNKEIIVFEIDTANEKYILKEGQNFHELLEQSNQKFIHSKAGYLVDVDSRFKTKAKADLILLSDIVLNSNPIDLDTIIIHELVHMLIDSGQDKLIELSDSSHDIGSQIYQMTDYPNQDRTKHSEDFCQLLAQACINYHNKTKNFTNETMVIKSAMRFDIFE